MPSRFIALFVLASCATAQATPLSPSDKAALLKDFPQIESATYTGGPPLTLLKDGEATQVEDGRLVDSAFLDTIALPMLHGDRKALSRPGTAAVSVAQAIKIFGTTNVVGRTVTLLTLGKKADYTITGVFKLACVQK